MSRCGVSLPAGASREGVGERLRVTDRLEQPDCAAVRRDNAERYLAGLTSRQRIAQLAERERRPEVAVPQVAHVVVQLAHRLRSDDQRDDQHDGDDDEAQGEPRAQGHVQSRVRAGDETRREGLAVATLCSDRRGRVPLMAQPRNAPAPASAPCRACPFGILGVARAPRHSPDHCHMSTAPFVRIAELSRPRRPDGRRPRLGHPPPLLGQDRLRRAARWHGHLPGGVREEPGPGRGRGRGSRS